MDTGTDVEEGGPVVGEISFGDDGDCLGELDLELGLMGEVDHDGDDLLLDRSGRGGGEGRILRLNAHSTFGE